MTDHDRLFKELLTTFFVEFVDLFLPEVSAHLERDSVEFLDNESFSDVTAGEKYEVDLLARPSARGSGVLSDSSGTPVVAAGRFRQANISLLCAFARKV